MKKDWLVEPFIPHTWWRYVAMRYFICRVSNVNTIDGERWTSVRRTCTLNALTYTFLYDDLPNHRPELERHSVHSVEPALRGRSRLGNESARILFPSLPAGSCWMSSGCVASFRLNFDFRCSLRMRLRRWYFRRTLRLLWQHEFYFYIVGLRSLSVSDWLTRLFTRNRATRQKPKKTRQKL